MKTTISIDNTFNQPSVGQQMTIAGVYYKRLFWEIFFFWKCGRMLKRFDITEVQSRSSLTIEEW